MRVVAWERYVPDVEDNRARHQRGEPALIVAIRPPTARIWRQYYGAIAEDAARRAKAATLEQERDELGTALRLAFYDDALAEILWRGCVGAVELPEGLIEGLATPIRDGAALWAARDTLDAVGLYTNVLAALFDRATLEAGLVAPLVSPSGPSVSRDPARARDGTAASVATPA